MVVVGLFGCAAIRTSMPFVLEIYSVLLFISFGGHVGFAAAAFFRKDQTLQWISEKTDGNQNVEEAESFFESMWIGV